MTEKEMLEKMKESTEEEMLEKIRESAEKVEIPESLKPRQIEVKLKGQKKPKRFQWQAIHLVAAAAVLAIVIGVLPIGSIKCKVGSDGVVSDSNMSVNNGNAETENENNRNRNNANVESRNRNNTNTEKETYITNVDKIRKKDAGELYQIAESYEEVFDFLKKNQEMTRKYYDGAVLENEVEDLAETITVGEIAEDVNLSSGSAAMNDAMSGNGIVKEEAAMETSAEKGYSTTNLQMSGVDESDIVKTNGSHIFVVKDGVVQIVELKSGKMTLVGTVSPQLESFSDKVLEMYVDGDRLILITQQVKEGVEGTSVEKITGGYLPVTEMAEEVCVDIAYRFDMNYQTVLYTYDISNPAKAEQIGKIEQDGYYKTSRKIEDMVYLFTQDSIEVETKNFTESEDVMELLPKVNGESISYDNIYLPNQGMEGLVISSVSLENPNAVVDNVLILNNYVEIYVSSSALYLYHSDYSADTLDTQIAKFTLDKGNISAVAAASVPGAVQDTFAVNEYQENLRVLTSYWNREIEENTNQLYILDENLKPLGKIEHIAEGETVYAARYFGDLAYFITYRNIDPLFAADLSDVRNPKIVGELKITGYSEYLHLWGEDKLLGIGYETDEKDGSREGIKLVMFDISNPTELSILDTVVLKNADESTALYDYKCVLADERTNMIGFTTVDYSEDELTYHVYSFQDGKFQEELAVCEEEIYGEQSYRGIWAGAYFYIVNQKEIKSYEYLNQYEKVDEMEL